ncbi:protein of unknown function [Moritella yayanosii]|uniref:Uncharacterized protein n=1 Tax=Moritella yayanosii TaxID=69539 RepID=A0A330LQ86_9GAMM|nr:protein of unknown function [Moritella yayanosii]
MTLVIHKHINKSVTVMKHSYGKVNYATNCHPGHVLNLMKRNMLINYIYNPMF